MVVFSLGMLLVQNSEVRMHRDVQRKALNAGCCFQGILAFQLLVGRRVNEN